MELLNELLPLVLPVVVAFLTQHGFELLQRGLVILNKAPVIIKQVAVVVIAFGLTKLSIMLGVDLPTTDIAGLAAEDLSALIAAGFAYAFHAGAKAKAVTA